MMAGADPVVLLVAAPDRASLVAALRRHRAMTADDLSALPIRSPGSGGAERVAIVARPTAIHDRLDLALERLPSLAARRLVVRGKGIYMTSQAAPGRVAFLFPGQGSEHVGMLRTLRERVPGVKAWFDTLDRAAEATSQPPLTPLIDGPLADRDDPRRIVAMRALRHGARRPARDHRRFSRCTTWRRRWGCAPTCMSGTAMASTRQPSPPAW